MLEIKRCLIQRKAEEMFKIKKYIFKKKINRNRGQLRKKKISLYARLNSLEKSNQIQLTKQQDNLTLTVLFLVVHQWSVIYPNLFSYDLLHLPMLRGKIKGLQKTDPAKFINLDFKSLNLLEVPEFGVILTTRKSQE